MADKLAYLDPNDILAEGNSRYGLKRYRLDRLKAEIVANNGVQVPIEVYPLPKDNPSGKKYGLTAGFYRHQSVTELNAEGAGLTIPSMIHPEDKPLDRLKRQLAENMERENQSPMDKAIAISHLLSENMTKMDIRKVFSVPGGRKGLTMQPASNSFINMTLSFLELPKDVQVKIHDGRIGVAAAYELTKIAPDKRQAVLEKIEFNRLAAIDAEDKAEAKFLEDEKKAATAGSKVAAVAKEFEAVATEAQSAEKALGDAQKAETEAIDKAAELYKISCGKFETAEAKKAASDAAKEGYKLASEASKATKKAEKDAETARKEAAKLQEKVKTAEEKAQANRDRLATARAGRTGAPAPSTAPVGPAEVRKAAASTQGATTETTHVALKAAEMKDVINKLALPGPHPIVQAIGVALKECFDGKTTPGQLNKVLPTITGELKAGKAGKK